MRDFSHLHAPVVALACIGYLNFGDTFDLYSPRYQSYHTHHEVFRWFEGTGLERIKVCEPGISVIGQRPVAG